MYDNVVSEDVPDEFLSFLEEADERKPDSDPQKKSLETESTEPAPVGRPVKAES
mgnify:FL=1